MSQVQIYSLLHIIYYWICSNMYQLVIAQNFWVAWAPNAGRAFNPSTRCYFSRLKVQANYSLSLTWLWIGKCWAQLVREQKDWSEKWFPSAIKRGHSDLNVCEAWKKYSVLRMIGPARKCLFSPHCTKWLLNLQKRGQSCTGLHDPFHHPKTHCSEFGKVQCSLFFHFFLHTNMKEIYFTVLMKISLTFCYKTNKTWKRHAAITGGCSTQRLEQLLWLLPPS